MKGLSFVTDRGLCGAKPLTDVVFQAIRGGAICVQLREKDVSTHFFVEEARRIKALMVPFRVPLIIKPNEANERYLKTKMEKLGHLLG